MLRQWAYLTVYYIYHFNKHEYHDSTMSQGLNFKKEGMNEKSNFYSILILILKIPTKITFYCKANK